MDPESAVAFDPELLEPVPLLLDPELEPELPLDPELLKPELEPELFKPELEPEVAPELPAEAAPPGPPLEPELASIAGADTPLAPGPPASGTGFVELSPLGPQAQRVAAAVPTAQNDRAAMNGLSLSVVEGTREPPVNR